MKKSKKPLGVFARLEKLYAAMQAEYDRLAAPAGFTCADCGQNCCVSYFQHHTYVEWTYLWRGMAALDTARRERFLERAEDYVRRTSAMLRRGLRPQIMCPLNEDGLCGLYSHRLMICRMHGTAHRFVRPDGVAERFPGCYRFEDLTREAETPPVLDRTPLYRELAAIEMAFLGDRLRALPKVNLTLAEMLVQGIPRIR
ncbi:MAG: hypothetical protein H0S85_01300 [Desulfovibrionaceae bacterium]|jgi:hypothetical protein|nr:hypothetical protein [Desulfovibrionaceae bacterium]